MLANSFPVTRFISIVFLSHTNSDRMCAPANQRSGYKGWRVCAKACLLLVFMYAPPKKQRARLLRSGCSAIKLKTRRLVV
jgi:hypothetical protein